jgi:hypothetical protein
MIRDLEYPQDARKVIDSLHQGLQYDAALAVMGVACANLPLPTADSPDLVSRSVQAGPWRMGQFDVTPQFCFQG